MATSDPFKNTNDKPKENWFIRTAIKGAILGGLAFGAYKMKGPAGKLINKFNENRMKLIFEKEGSKVFDQNDIVDTVSDFSSKNEFYDKRLDMSKVSTDIRTDLAPDAFTRGKIDRMEQAILSNAENKLNPLLKPPRNPERLSFFLKLKDSEFQREQLFADVRRESLLDYFSSEGGADLSTVKDFMSWQGKKSPEIIDKINKLHTQLLSENQLYANVYKRNVGKLTSNIIQLDELQPKTLGQFKRMLYRGVFKQDVALEADMRVYADRYFSPSNVAQILKVGKHANNIDVFSELDRGNLNDKLSFTSDSGTRRTSHELFNQIQKFDYTGQLKTLANTLRDLQNNSTETGVQEVDLRVERYGSQNYVKVKLTHMDKSGYEFSIPLSQDGRMPASTPAGNSRIDSSFVVKDPLIAGHGKLEWMNRSQMMIHNVIQRLKSDSFVTNEFKNNPTHAISRIVSEIQTAVMELPLMTGETRDAYKMLSVQSPLFKAMVLPDRNESKYMRHQLTDAIQSQRNIKAIADARKRGKKVLGLALDFETLGMAGIGPQHQAADPNTQVYKAGIVASDLSSGNRIIYGEELVSDHGVDFFWRKHEGTGKGWVSGPDGNINWIRKMVDGSDKIQDDLDVVKEFTKMIKNDSAGNKGRSRSTQEFVEKTLDTLISQVKHYKSQGYEDIYLTGKNANNFDFKFLQSYSPGKYQELKKLLNGTIDTNSVAYKQKLGHFGEESLALNRMIQEMMGTLGLDPVDIAKPGNLEIAVRRLRQMNGKGNRLSMDDSVFDSMRKFWGQKAHLSAAADNVFNFVLLEKYVQEAMDNTKEYGSDLNRIDNWLKRGGRVLGFDETAEIYDMLEGRHVQYGFVQSGSGATSGMLAKMMFSMLHINHMLPFADNNYTKQWDQLHHGVKVRPGKVWVNRLGGLDKARANPAFKKRFIDPLVTKAAMSATDFVMGAEDQKNYFSHHVMANTLYVWNNFMGREGFSSISKKVLREAQPYAEQMVNLTEAGFLNNPEIHNSVLKRLKDIDTKARELARGGDPSRYREQAAALLDAENPINLPIGSRMAIARGELQLKTSKAEIGGRIVDVMVQGNQIAGKNKLALMAKLEYAATGEDSYRITMRSIGGKADTTIIGALADKMAFGVEVVQSADFIDKEFAGSLKEVLLRKAIYGYQERIARGGPGAFEAQEQIKQLARKLNAHWTGEKMIMDTEAAPAFNLKRVDKENADAVHRLIGNANIGVTDLIEEVKKSGQVWTDEKLKAYYSFFGKNETEGRKFLVNKVEETIKSHKSKLDKMYKEKIEGMDLFMKEDMYTIQSNVGEHLKKMLLPEAGDAVTMEIRSLYNGDQDKTPNWDTHVLGINVPNMRHVFYNVNGGTGVHRSSMKIRQNYMINIDSGGNNVSASTLHYLKSNMNHRLKVQAFQAKKTLERFRNALLSSAMTSGEQLTPEELNKLIDRSSMIDLVKEIERLDGLGDDKIIERVRELLKFNNLTDNELNEYAKNILDEIKTSKNMERFIKPGSQWMSIEHTNIWGDMAKKKGVFKIGEGMFSGIDDVFKIDLNKIMSFKNITPDEARGQVNKLLHTFQAIAEKAPDGIVKKIETDEAGKAVIHLREMAMAAQERSGNVANFLTSQIGRATDETRAITDVLVAAKELQELAAMGGTPDTAKLNLIESQKIKLHKRFVNYLLDGATHAANSLYGFVDDIEVPALQTPFRGGEGVIFHAHSLKKAMLAKGKGLNDPGLLRLMDNSKKAKHIGDLADRILNARANAVFMTTSMFEKLEASVGGKVMNYARHIQSMGKEGTSTMQQIKKGLQTGVGFMARYPMEQQGNDAVQDVFIQAIPDEYAGLFGMDKNALYVQDIIGKNLKIDHDGDTGVIGVKNLSTVEEFWKHHTEHVNNLNKIVASNEYKNAISENAFVQPLDFNPETGKVVVSGYNKQGRINLKEVDISDVPFQDSWDKIAGLLRKSAMHSPDVITGRYAMAQHAMVASSAIMKTQIGVMTNVIQNVTHAVRLSGAVKNPRIMADIAGNLTHGFASINQAIMKFGKEPGDVSKFGAASQLLMNPLKENKQAYQFLKNELWIPGFSHLADETGMVQLGKNKMHYKEYAGRLFDMSMKIYKSQAAAKKSDGMVRDILKSHENILFERAGAVNADYLMEEADFFSYVQSKFKAQADELTSPISYRAEPGLFDDLGVAMKKSSKIRNFLDSGNAATFRKAGKYGAIGAGLFLAANFFRPNQLSNSANPLDGFVDLGVDLDGNHNIFKSRTELGSEQDLEMINASFSREAFIKSIKPSNGRDNSAKSNIINNLLKNAISKSDTFIYDVRSAPNYAYANYTTNIGYFGSSHMERSYK